jgi:hypothetical protein
MTRLRRALAQHPLLVLSFLAASLAVLAFATLFTLHALRFPQGRVSDQPIEGWMTPGYVAHSWHLPPQTMAEALGLAPGEGRGRTLAEIARARNISVEDLAQRIEAAAAAHRAAAPPAPAPAPALAPATETGN